MSELVLIAFAASMVGIFAGLVLGPIIGHITLLYWRKEIFAFLDKLFGYPEKKE